MTKKQSVTPEENPVLVQVRTVRGTATRIARAIGISRAAVSGWTRVPADRVLAVEGLLGIPRHLIRPDLYQPPPHHPRTRRWMYGINNSRRKLNGQSRRRQQHL
jgi:DNA-binding transcriptional regulator YdaS (Cro superfamily)